MRSLREIYQGVVAKYEAARELRQQCDFVVRALKMGYMEPARDLIEKTAFESHQSRRILDAVIATDNLDVFNAAFKVIAKENPNYLVTHEFDMGPGGPGMYDTAPLLSFAISQKAEKIALMLALNPKTDVTLKGHSVKFNYTGRSFAASVQLLKTETVHESAVDLARKAGMNSLAGVLLERTARLADEQANDLRSQAHSLKP